MESSLFWMNKQVLFHVNTTYDAKPLVCLRISMTSRKPESRPGQKPGVKTSVHIDSTWKCDCIHVCIQHQPSYQTSHKGPKNKRCPTWRFQRAQNQQTCCFHPITWLTKSYSTKWSPIAVLPMMEIPKPTSKARHWWWPRLSAATKIFSEANGKSTFPVPTAAVNWNAMDGKVGFATWLTL